MTAAEPALARLRETVAQACRILALEGLVEGVLGHVSARVDDTRMLLRCRGPAERGLELTSAEDVRLVDLDGHGDDPASGYAAPNELPIHGELLRARPEVGAVVHAHPPARGRGRAARPRFRLQRRGGLALPRRQGTPARALSRGQRRVAGAPGFRPMNRQV
jgi:hypothetical protein